MFPLIIKIFLFLLILPLFSGTFCLSLTLNSNSSVGFRRGLDLHADGSAGKPVGRVRVLPAVVRASPCSVRGPGRTPEDSVGARPGHLHLLIRSGPGS